MAIISIHIQFILFFFSFFFKHYFLDLLFFLIILKISFFIRNIIPQLFSLKRILIIKFLNIKVITKNIKKILY